METESRYILKRPFPSCREALFQIEAKCRAIDMKIIIIFYPRGNKTHAHKKGFALSVVLKVRDFVTQKWPIIVINVIGTVKLLNI